MEKEEARNILEEYVKACKEDDFPALEMFDYEEVIEAMTMGAKALSQLSLPSNLDEAAEDRVTENGRFELTASGKMSIDDIRFGAEWMAGQGVTKEAVIGMATEEISINVSKQTLDELDLCPGDKVVVQIRKAK